MVKALLQLLHRLKMAFSLRFLLKEHLEHSCGNIIRLTKKDARPFCMHNHTAYCNYEIQNQTHKLISVQY